MSKTKQQNHNEVKYLKDVIKDQRTKIKYLKRRIAELENQLHMKKQKPNKEVEETCGNCGKGHFEYHDFLHINYKICVVCGYKEKV